jgi:hypothetical protein
MNQKPANPIQDFQAIVVMPFLESIHELVKAIENKFDKPEYIVIKETKAWRYANPRLEHICIQRLYRIISGLYACANLLRFGQIQEIGVILRTVTEFQQDIVFLLEDYKPGQPNDAQKKFVEEITKEGYVDLTVPFKGATPRETMSRKKIEASVARHYGMGQNPSDYKQITSLENDILGGFVHAVYPSVMDIYGGDFENPQYHPFGILTKRIFSTWSSQIMIYMERLFYKAYLVAHNFGLEKIGLQAISVKESWDIEAAKYGHFLPKDDKKAMRNLKKGKPLE